MPRSSACRCSFAQVKCKTPDQSLVNLQRPTTPPYVIRESTRINALESTVQRIATDLSSSKDQLREVKELLLRLINPQMSHPAPPPPIQSTPIPVSCGEMPGVSSHRHLTPVAVVTPAETSDARHAPIANATHNPGQHPLGESATFATTPYPPPPIRNPVEDRAPSWASGDTIPLTRNTVLQNFTNRMPVGAAVSHDVSASIRTAGAYHSPHASIDNMSAYSEKERGHVAGGTTSELHTSPAHEAPITDGVSTRRMTNMQEIAHPVRAPRMRYPLNPLPRLSSNPLAANCFCYVQHPEKGDTIVAEGRTGGSWKSHSAKFGKFCSEGEQMVQIHKILVPNLPLIFVEDRQPFTLLEHALVKPSGSSVYIKWHSRLLRKKGKGAQA